MCGLMKLVSNHSETTNNNWERKMKEKRKHDIIFRSLLISTHKQTNLHWPKNRIKVLGSAQVCRIMMF